MTILFAKITDNEFFNKVAISIIIARIGNIYWFNVLFIFVQLVSLS